jgi:uncharacterized membrane protein
LLSNIINLITNPYLAIILLTFTPFLELRASIPYGILIAKLPWYNVISIAIISNILLAPMLYFFVTKVIQLFFFIKPFERWYHKKLEKTQKKAKPLIDKYGLLGLAIFIGIPLPGSGVYSGTLIAYLLNMGYKKFLYAAILGVFIAAISVTLITISAGSANTFITKLFLKI